MSLFRPRRWREPPIVFQILVLLLGGLVVAQFVTLLLTIVLPPAPPVQHGLNEIVSALRDGSDRRLARTVQAGPPDIGGPGWFTSDQSRREMAARLGVDEADVRLAFYAPLPFAGTAALPVGPASGARPVAWTVFPEPLHATPAGLMRANLLLIDQPGGAPGGGGFPGGGGAGGFPSGGGFPRDGSGGFGDGDRSGFGGRDGDRGGFQRGDRGQRGDQGRMGGSAGDMLRQDQRPFGRSASPSDLDRQPIAPGARDDYLDGTRDGWLNRDIQTMPLQQAPAATPAPPPPAPEPEAEATPAPARTEPRPAPAEAIPVPTPAVTAPPVAEAAPRKPAPRTVDAPALPIMPQTRALFGLAPAPFIEGDFVAAARQTDGRWVVVQPAAEAFPNAWQRRVMLWFAIAFAIVTPIGWLYARHIVRPLARFTDAAETLGRDPSAALVALEGPAEIGRAAHAFNVMQNRLRSFVDDRTAMVGAISHDLRTPLTRLRFRIEEVDDEGVRDGMTEEVAEMEAMITSVLTFIRDASTPNVRERLDLGMLVEDVAQNAAMVGGDVSFEAGAPATVEVDVLGMRRVLANLVENAVKYGDRARIRLAIEEDAAVAEISDDGPGIPEDELEHAFEPFYRASNAAASGKEGTGLGLAVCRSIARSHGGDVRLVRKADGFAAQLRLPLAYDAGRIAA